MLTKVTNRALGLVSSLALVIAVGSASSLCFWYYHQPDVPAELKKYDE